MRLNEIFKVQRHLNIGDSCSQSSQRQQEQGRGLEMFLGRIVLSFEFSVSSLCHLGVVLHFLAVARGLNDGDVYTLSVQVMKWRKGDQAALQNVDNIWCIHMLLKE